MSHRIRKLLQTHLKNLATEVLEVVAEDVHRVSEPPESYKPPSAQPTPKHVPEAEDEHPFVEIPDELAFQIRELVQEKQQISQGLYLIRQAFTAQSQRIDALYQELRARYGVPQDPGYVLHISKGEGDPSGFRFLERTFPTEEPEPELEVFEGPPVESEEGEPSDDKPSMNQES